LNIALLLGLYICLGLLYGLLSVDSGLFDNSLEKAYDKDQLFMDLMKSLVGTELLYILILLFYVFSCSLVWPIYFFRELIK
jgi:hypothetical protein